MREDYKEDESKAIVVRLESEKYNQDSIREIKRKGLSIRDPNLSISFIKRELNYCKKERICEGGKFL